MAVTIPQWLVQQYADSVEHLYQQEYAYFSQFVRMKTGVIGERTSFDRLGESDFEEIVGRHEPTTGMDPEHSRRWVSKRDFFHNIYLSATDELELLVNAQESYITNGAMALGRLRDRLILRAAEGNAFQGKETTTPIALPAGQIIAVGGTGMSPDKFREARRILSVNNVGLSDLNMGRGDAFVAAISPRAHEDMLSATEATSTDYLGVVIVNGQEEARRMPLVGGMIPLYMGFRILQTNELTLVGTTRQNLFWHKNAMGLAVWQESFMSVDVLPQQHYDKQVYRRTSQNATRIHDEGVVRVDSLEA